MRIWHVVVIILLIVVAYWVWKNRASLGSRLGL